VRAKEERVGDWEEGLVVGSGKGAEVKEVEGKEAD